jgi:hypothetical protein
MSIPTTQYETLRHEDLSQKTYLDVRQLNEYVLNDSLIQFPKQLYVEQQLCIEKDFQIAKLALILYKESPKLNNDATFLREVVNQRWIEKPVEQIIDSNLKKTRISMSKKFTWFMEEKCTQ